MDMSKMDKLLNVDRAAFESLIELMKKEASGEYQPRYSNTDH